MSGVIWWQSRQRLEALDRTGVPFAVPGTLFGESIFETMRAYSGRIFRLDAHFDRMRRSLVELGWRSAGDPVVMAMTGLREVLSAPMLANWGDLRIRITVFNAGDPSGFEDGFHSFQWAVQAMPYTPPAAHTYANGIAAIATQVRIEPQAVWSRHKTGNRLAYRQAAREMAQKGAKEGILLSAEGYLVDGTMSNFFWVQDGVIMTPPLALGCLPGITRQEVLDLAMAEGMPVEAGKYTPDSIFAAQEAFCTNALIGVLPVTVWNQRPIGSGRPGPITTHLSYAYQRRVAEAARLP